MEMSPRMDRPGYCVWACFAITALVAVLTLRLCPPAAGAATNQAHAGSSGFLFMLGHRFAEWRLCSQGSRPLPGVSGPVHRSPPMHAGPLR